VKNVEVAKERDLDARIAKLAKQSRFGGVLTAIGLTIFFVVLLGTAYVLDDTTKVLKTRTVSLEDTTAKLDKKTVSLEKATTELNEKNKDLISIKSEIEGAQNTSAMLQIELEQLNDKLAETYDENNQLALDKKVLEAALKELRAVVGNLIPDDLLLYPVSKEQADVAEKVKTEYLALDVDSPPNIRIITNREGDPPYATEVRYFNYPQDIELAQSICLRLQRDFNEILSRISYVEDSRPKGTIEVHFRKL